jgi:beta-lactamase regulating signal transducer with metallopeptidase domain
LLHFVWQGVVVAMLLWITLAALRKGSANGRYVASCAALGVLAVLPVVTAWVASSRPAPGAVVPLVLVTVTGFVQGAPRTVTWREWLLPVWACGVLLLSLRMLWGCAKVSGFKRQGEEAEPAVMAVVEGLARRVRMTRPVRVLISSLADGPSVVGWIRPVLLLPAATLLGLNAEQLEAVLAHELAHIRRHDYLVNMVQMLIETLFFYHPAVWWISRRIREERELCCDDIAVRTCGDAICYARALAALERMRVLEPGLMFGGALGAKDGPLQYRIERLLGIVRREQPPSRLPGMIAICLGLACFAPAMDPAKADSAKAQMPMPPALAPIQAPQAPPTDVPKPAPRMVAQAVQPGAAAPVPPGASTPAEDLLVEVSVDSYGTVNDARVISGPMESRRYALIAALNKRFPPGGPPTEFVVMKAVRALPFTGPNGIQRVYSGPDAQNAMTKAIEQIAKLRAQQAEASEKGAAQLQELIDSDNLTIASMQRTLAGENPLIGKRLEDIRITGSITDDAGARLLGQLPVHLHDVLSQDTMAGVIRAVKRDYPDAEVYFGYFGSAKSGTAGLVVGVR